MEDIKKYIDNIITIRESFQNILEKFQLLKHIYFLDKDDHKFYLAEHLFPGSSLIYSVNTQKNSSASILNALEEYKPDSYMIFFKPTYELINLAISKGFIPLQTDYLEKLKIENKISIYNKTPEKLRDLYPKTIIKTLSELNHDYAVKELKYPFIIQLGSGYSGKNTFEIKSRQDLMDIKEIFYNVRGKAVKKIEGSTYTINGFIYEPHFLYSQPFIQISKDLSLNPNYFGSCGNIFKDTNIDEKVLQSFLVKIRELLFHLNYQGFFGIDFIIGDLPYLIEINPRFTTSLSIESEQSILSGRIPLFAYEILRLIVNKYIKDKDLVQNSLLDLKSTEKKLSKISPKASITNLIQYNTQKTGFISKNQIRKGTYKLYNGKPHRVSDNLLFGKIPRDNFILHAPVIQRPISHGNEIARLIFNNQSFDIQEMISLINAIPWQDIR